MSAEGQPEAGRWDALQRRIWVQGRLVAQTALHIGGGEPAADPTTVDAAVVRDASGNPLLPGSSLKGAVRAWMERLADAGWLEGEDGAAGCAHRVPQREWERWVASVEADAGRIAAALCPACRLLGAPHFAGRLLIADLPVVPGSGPGRYVGEQWRLLPGVRSGVGIDRETGTAADRVRYDFEVVPAGTAFHLQWLLENPTDADWRNALRALLALVRGDIPLGGKVTRGLGRVVLSEARVWDLRREDGSLRRYVLARRLEDLPWRPLEEAAAQAGLPGFTARRLPLARLREALDGEGEVGWEEALTRLTTAFGTGAGDGV